MVMDSTITLTQDEALIILALGRMVRAGRPTGATFTARSAAAWCASDLPLHLSGERTLTLTLDLLGLEPAPRTGRRSTRELRECLPHWIAQAEAQTIQQPQLRADVSPWV